MKNLYKNFKDNILLGLILIVLISLFIQNWDNGETLDNNEIILNNFENFKLKERVSGGFIYENLKGEILFIDDQDAKVYKVLKEIKVQFDESGYEIEKIISN